MGKGAIGPGKMTLRRVMMALVALVALSAGALRAQSILPTTATTCAQGALSFSSRPVDTVPSLVSSQPLVLLRGVTDMSTIDSPTYQADFTGSNQGTQLAANLIQSQVLLFQQASLDTQLNPDHRWGSSFGYSTLVFGNTQTIGQEVQLLPTYDSSPAFMLRTNSDLTITHDSRALSYGPGLWPVAISFRSSDPFLVARDASGQHRLVEYDNGSPRTFAIEAPLTAAGHFRAGAGRVIFAWVNSALYTVTRGSSGSLDLVLQAMPSCQIVDFAATRVLATSARREDVLVLFDDRSFLVLLNFDEEIDSDTAVYAGTLPAEVSNDGRIVHVPSTDTRSPVGWVLYLDHSPPSAAGATVPGAADARVTSRPALWRVSFGSPITWQPVALPSSSDATTVQAFFSGSLNQWIMTDGLRGLYTPEQFKCAVDHSITCDPMVPGRLGATSPEGWTCIPGQVLSPMRLPNRLCSGCPAGYFLQPDGQDPNVFECVACPSGCDACIGDTCLACGGDLLLLTEGQTTRCVATCPEGTRAGMDHCMGETAKPAIQFQLQPATPPADVTLSIVGLARTSIMVKEGVLHLPMAFPPAEYHYFAMLSTGQVAWFNGRDIEPVGSTSDVEPLPLVWAPLPHATTTSLVELGPFNHEGAQVLVLFSCSQNSLFYTILRCGIGGQGASCPSASSSPILLSSGACYNIRAFDERRVTAYLGQYVAFEVKDDTGQVSIQTINVLPTVPQAGPPVPALGPDPAPPGNQAVWSILGDSMGALYLAPLTVVGQRDPRFAWRPMVTAPHGFSVLNLATGHGDPAFETVWTGMTGQSTSTFWEARYGPLGTRPHGRTSDLHEIRHRLFEVPPAVQLGGIFALTLGLPDFPSALLLLLSNQVVVSMFHCPAGGAALCRLLPGVSVPLPINFSSTVSAMTIVPFSGAPPGAGALDGASGPSVSFLLACSGQQVLRMDLAVAPCPAGRFGSLCQPCHASCLDECTGPGPEDCLACRAWHIHQPGVCLVECPPDTTPLPHRGCTPCSGVCDTCGLIPSLDRHMCTACPDMFFLEVDPAAAPTPAGVCLPCHFSCHTCTGPTGADCLTCPAGMPWHENRCVTSCPPGFWNDQASSSCLACPTGCASCLSPVKCTNCRVGFFPNGSGACAPCDASCHTCAGGAGACTACRPGLVFLDADPNEASICGSTCAAGDFLPAAANRCAACDPSCALCSGSKDNCTVCAAGHRWASGTVGPGECVACGSGCRTCTATRCLTCAAGQWLTPEGTCQPGCPAGWFADAGTVDGTGAGGGECQMCDVECAECDQSAGHCTACAPGLDLVTDGAGATCRSGCAPGEYRDPVSLACLPCHAACAECNGPTDRDCWSCAGPEDVLQGGACVQTCADRHVALAQRCLPCHASCDACAGTRSSECTVCGADLRSLPALEDATTGRRCVPACPVGHATTDTGCRVCAANCAQCSGGGPCDQCARGWLLDMQASATDVCVHTCPALTFPFGGACSVCHGSCGTCFGPGPDQCLSCTGGTPLMWAGQCVAVCPTGAYQPLTEGVCIACHPQCATCMGGLNTDCVTCHNDMLLQPAVLAGPTGHCVSSCPERHFAQADHPSGPRCVPCHASCASCAGPGANQCLGCPEGALLHQDHCRADCPPGFFGCHPARQCRACPDGCTACEPFDGTSCASVCTTCEDGRFLTAEGRCEVSCPAGQFRQPGGQLCGPCHAGCRTCEASAERCTSCPAAGWLDYESRVCLQAGCPAVFAAVTRPADPAGPGPDRVCLPCPEHCEACTGAADAELPAGVPACRLPAADGPLSCTLVAGCDRCVSGRLLHREPGAPARCVLECPPGFFADQEAAVSAIPACMACPAGCLACLGPLKTECTEWSGLSPKSRLAIGLGVGLGLLSLLLLILVALALIYFSRRRKASPMAPKGDDDVDATVLNTILELSLPGSIMVNIGADFMPLTDSGDLGAGTQATVYAARAVGAGISDRLGCPSTVAIKRLKEGAARSTTQMTLFQNEVALMWLLRDVPNVVRLYGYSDAPPAIVMECYQTDLSTLLQSEIPLDTCQLLGIACQWASGLEAMHAQGIAHCDLKPGNVFVMQRPDGTWHAALGDLGTSRNLSEERSNALTSAIPSLNALTARYAAPEVFMAFNRKQALPKEACLPADMYSAALLLWETLARQSPWEGLGFEEILANSVGGARPDIQEAISPERNPTLQASPIVDLIQLAWDSNLHTRPMAAVFRQKISMALAMHG